MSRHTVNAAFFTQRGQQILLYRPDLKSASKLMNVNLNTEAERKEIAIPLVFVEKPTSDSLCHFLIRSP